MKGIERSVDKLGRIVLPIKYRERLGIETDDVVLLTLENGVITVSPSKKLCALCESVITHGDDIKLCARCIQKIKEQ